MNIINQYLGEIILALIGFVGSAMIYFGTRRSAEAENIVKAASLLLEPLNKRVASLEAKILELEKKHRRQRPVT
jgi:hypothetical protein